LCGYGRSNITPIVNHTNYVMKNVKLSLLAVLLLGAVACQKSNTSKQSGTAPTVSGSITTDDAADIASGALSQNSNGVSDMATDATTNASAFEAFHPKCGTIRSDTVSRQSASGSQYTYSYSLTYNFVVDCNSSSQPDSLSSNLTYSGSYSGPNMSGTNSGSSSFGVGGLLSTDTAFVINGEYKRAGAFASKVDTAKHGNTNVDLVVTNLTLRKPGRMIESGSATISITGSTPRRGTFSYTGTIVFNGNNTAKLTINSIVYTINLLTGMRQRI
jgi:hypothetical protein